jgi:glutamine cyclotransferase
MKRIIGIVSVLVIILAACQNTDQNNNSNAVSTNVIPVPTVMNYQVIKVFPHDTSAYTEGLYLENGFLFEGTGNYGESFLAKVNLSTGKAVKKITLNSQYFGEGISRIGNKIYQLTYREHKVFVYDTNFNKLPQEFEWPYEGWGMTTDGKSLILDTGGSNLYFVNPETFKIERTLGVSDNNGYLSMINELEYVDGYVYANVYQTDDIIKINLSNGMVEARANLKGILEANNQPYYENRDVLNGIAYNPATKTFYITGKKWPALFEVRFN